MTKTIKLIPGPLTDEELYEIAQMEGDFDKNYKLAMEVRENHSVENINYVEQK